MGNTFHIFLVLSTFSFLALTGPANADGSVPPTYQYNTLNISMPVDHNSSINNVFNLRYLRNDDYWDPQSGAPIFFYAGNGENVTLAASKYGFIWDAAEQFKALVVFAEHRYYGTSLPFGEDTFSDPKNLAYLTVEQALADYVTLIENLNAAQEQTYPNGMKSPVIAIGAAYGGILSAYLRMKYPDLIIGALSSAGNIWNYDGIYDCESFYESVTNTYKNVNNNCSNNVRKTWDAMKQIGSTDEGRQNITSMFSLCETISSNTDLESFYQWCQNMLMGRAMYDFPYSIPGVVANPVNSFCNELSDASLEGQNLIEAFRNGLQSWYTLGFGQCVEWQTTSNTPAELNPWEYQTCTEMVYPQCTNGINDMFLPQPWNLKQKSQFCFQKYQVYPNPSFMVSQYGGKNIGSSSNIIFSNGLLDPWSTGGVLESVSSTLVAIKMPDAGHCLDLRATNPADPQDVTQARVQFKAIFQQWINEFHSSN